CRSTSRTRPCTGSSSGSTTPSTRAENLRLRVDDHVRDVGALATDPLLDLAGARVSLVEPARAAEAEGQERDEPAVGAKEAELLRLEPRRLAHDAPDERLALRRHLLRGARLRQRLEVRLHAGDLGHGRADR